MPGEAAPSYRLDPRRPVADEVRRVARAEVEAARAQLARPAGDIAEVVHEVRKHGKKLRGLLRLVRPALGEATYRAANAFVRDAALRLSELRDATSLLECVDRLVAAVGDAPGAEHLPALRENLEARRVAIQAYLDQRARLARFAAEMDQLLGDLEGWTLEGEGFDAVGPGLARSYAAGAAAMRAAYRAPSFEAFHTWRKRAKDHRYHLELLLDLWPGVLPAFHDAGKHLTDLLGHAQDLAVLDGALEGSPALVPDPAARRAVRALAAGHRAALLAEARPLGRRVYAERGPALRRRFGRYWLVAAAG